MKTLALTLALMSAEEPTPDFLKPVVYEPACEVSGRFETWEVLAIAFGSLTLGVILARYSETGKL